MNIRLTKHDFAWMGESPRRVFQYDVRGYPPGEGAGISQVPHENWALMRWNEKEQTEWMGDFPTADAALAELQARFEQGDSVLISGNKIEGSLDIMWMNFNEQHENPMFGLHFMPYRGIKDGGQRRKEIVGKEALKTYLQQLGFPWLRVYAILRDVDASFSTDLANVMMNEYEYAVTYRN